jgi:hypothetical protein
VDAQQVFGFEIEAHAVGSAAMQSTLSTSFFWTMEKVEQVDRKDKKITESESQKQLMARCTLSASFFLVRY